MPTSSEYHTLGGARRPYGNLVTTNSKSAKTPARLRSGRPFTNDGQTISDPTEYIFLTDYTIAGKKDIDGLTYEQCMINMLQRKAIHHTGWDVGKFPNGCNWQWFENAVTVESAEGPCGYNLKLPAHPNFAIAPCDYPDQFHYYVTNDGFVNDGKQRTIAGAYLDAAKVEQFGISHSFRHSSNGDYITTPYTETRKGFINRRFGRKRFIGLRLSDTETDCSPTHLGSVKVHKYANEGVPLISCYTRPDAGTYHFSKPSSIQAINDSIVFRSSRPVVIIALGYNDIYSADPMVASTPELYEANLQAMINGIDADIVLVTPFHSMAMPHAINGTNHDDYRACIYRLADINGLKVIDLGAIDFNDYFVDDFHLGKAGNELLADVFFDELEFYKLATPNRSNGFFNLTGNLARSNYSNEIGYSIDKNGVVEFSGIIVASNQTALAGDEVQISVGTLPRFARPCNYSNAPTGILTERRTLVPVVIGKGYLSGYSGPAVPNTLIQAHLVCGIIGGISIRFTAQQAFTNETLIISLDGARFNTLY